MIGSKETKLDGSAFVRTAVAPYKSQAIGLDTAIRMVTANAQGTTHSNKLNVRCELYMLQKNWVQKKSAPFLRFTEIIYFTIAVKQ